MNKKDKEKIKEVRREEKYSYRMAKLMDKYGDPIISKYVTENPNTILRLAYEVYLEEEKRVNIRYIVSQVFLAIAIVLLIVSFFFYEFFVLGLLALFFGSDMSTNVRIDRMEQRRWGAMVHEMYHSEEEENEK